MLDHQFAPHKGHHGTKKGESASPLPSPSPAPGRKSSTPGCKSLSGHTEGSVHVLQEASPEKGSWRERRKEKEKKAEKVSGKKKAIKQNGESPQVAREAQSKEKDKLAKVKGDKSEKLKSSKQGSTGCFGCISRKGGNKPGQHSPNLEVDHKKPHVPKTSGIQAPPPSKENSPAKPPHFAVAAPVPPSPITLPDPPALEHIDNLSSTLEPGGTASPADSQSQGSISTSAGSIRQATQSTATPTGSIKQVSSQSETPTGSVKNKPVRTTTPPVCTIPQQGERTETPPGSVKHKTRGSTSTPPGSIKPVTKGSGCTPGRSNTPPGGSRHHRCHSSTPPGSVHQVNRSGTPPSSGQHFSTSGTPSSSGQHFSTSGTPPVTSRPHRGNTFVPPASGYHQFGITSSTPPISSRHHHARSPSVPVTSIYQPYVNVTIGTPPTCLRQQVLGHLSGGNPIPVHLHSTPVLQHHPAGSPGHLIGTPAKRRSNQSLSTSTPQMTRFHLPVEGSAGHLHGSTEDNRILEDTSPTTRAMVEHRQLLTEMRAQNFDVIRFATYRTACKLRFLQRKTNLYLVDIWNVIEAFRENGLNSLEPHSEVNVPRLESLLTGIYFQLNKRLPTSNQINVDSSIALLLHWLLTAYDPEGTGRVRVLSVKVSLATMCSGKLMDKLRYVFTLVSDSSGYLVRSKFEDYLKEILTLPTAVFEGPSFGYNETAARACFDGRTRVNVNDFLDTLMSDPGPQCLMWLPILHRMAQVENVFHPVQCEGCHRESFMGFRYKCQRCYNYHLCQDCFWRGRVSGNHSNDHEMKEYSSYKSPTKQFSHNLRKSFRCVPARGNARIPHFPETPEKTLDLTHIVPATPVPVHNGIHESSRSHSIDMSSLESSSATRSPSKLHSSLESNRIDDEHRLIARYAARLAADANNASRSPTELNFSLDSNRAQRELIAQLEAKNREIMHEIQRLRMEQEAHAKATPEGHQRNPTLLAELRLLRQRRDELEARMSALQESRRELMVQLEGLMKLLKSHGSPRSTPNSSPRGRCPGSPPIPPPPPRGSTPSTPGDSLVGVGGDVRQAFGQHTGSSASGSVRSLRNDLLVAADSVTNAMSSLVKELNSEASGSSDEDDDFRKPRDLDETGLDELAAWREEMQKRLQQESEFIAQLRARKSRSGHSSQSDSEHEHYIPTDDGESFIRTDDESFLIEDNDSESYVMRTDDEDAELYDQDPKELQHRYMTDDESCLETDQESYIRTDDEEGGNTEWEETMRRWVNR